MSAPNHKPEKVRVDQLVVERGLFATRNQAQAAILAGEIYSGENLLSKPGHMVKADIPLSLRSRTPKYVSRGGYKMEGALRDFHLNVAGWACLDIGSSTGGFTDCLLQHGASRVHCFDVGKGQLDCKLRNDPRIQVEEGVNVRYLKPEHVPDAPFDLAVIDVSFISLSKILPAIAPLVRPRAGLVLALIKPQFEVGPAAIAKGGIVRDPKARESAVHNVVSRLAESGLTKIGVHTSCLHGTDGNIEYFLLGEREP